MQFTDNDNGPTDADLRPSYIYSLADCTSSLVLLIHIVKIIDSKIQTARVRVNVTVYLCVITDVR